MGASIRDIQEGACIRGCLEDDPAALEAFYRAYNPRLVRYLKRRLGDSLLAEDFAQETLIKALKGLDGFDPARPLWPWLRAIALNLIIDHDRKGGPEVPCAQIYRSTRDPAERTDETIMLGQALGALSGRHRAALSLRYLNDWKPTEAAQFLGMSRPAFDQLLSRAKRRLGVEYRRMHSGLQGILVLQADRLRDLLRGRSSRLSRRITLASTDVPSSIMTSVSQVLTATAVVITAVAAPTVTAPPSRSLEGPFAPDQNFSAHAASKSGKQPSRENNAAAGETPSGDGTGVRPPVTEDQSAGGQGPRDLNDKADDFVDPNKDVDDPEDATLTSFAFGDEDGSTAYAAGKTHCRLSACPPVLFRTEDGGATWTRLDAEGFDGTEIALAPGDKQNHLLFAMGPSGLQVSRNGGGSFGPALLSGTPMVTGSMAVSPRFNEGDPTVLVGADTLFRYSDSTGLMDPYARSLSGPFEPAFSVDYATSGVFYLGAMRSSGVGGMRSIMSRCDTEECYPYPLPVRDQLPKIRLVSTRPDLLFAFTETGLFVSEGDEIEFQRVALPWMRPSLLDVRSLRNGKTLVAATASIKPSRQDGLYISNDEGNTWTLSESHLFRSGALTIAATGSQVLVALRSGGLACSSNSGRTFARRC